MAHLICEFYGHAGFKSLKVIFDFKRMIDLTKKVIKIYNEEGVIELINRSTIFIHVKSKKMLRYYMSTSPITGRIILALSVYRLNKKKKQEKSSDDILNTVAPKHWGDVPRYRGFGIYNSIHTIQDKEEITELIQVVNSIKPKTVAEIGTGYGGSLYLWCRLIDSADHIISIDLPANKWKSHGFSDLKTPLFEEFTENSEMDFVRGDSKLESTKQELRDKMSKNDITSIDFLYIDGDHSYEGVSKDFNNYSELMSEGGIIALHDIANPKYPGVKKFWEETKNAYNTKEIINENTDYPKSEKLGIGIVYF